MYWKCTTSWSVFLLEGCIEIQVIPWYCLKSAMSIFKKWKPETEDGFSVKIVSLCYRPEGLTLHWSTSSVLPSGGSKDFIWPRVEEVKQNSPAAQCILILFILFCFFNVKCSGQSALYFYDGENGPDVVMTWRSLSHSVFVKAKYAMRSQ